ncbi:MAG: hypothetical protein JST93_21495 [Acidobacteria bacterium]|nr:hypothetical protein [Acidobacteriota bacterium]
MAERIAGSHPVAAALALNDVLDAVRRQSVRGGVGAEIVPVIASEPIDMRKPEKTFGVGEKPVECRRGEAIADGEHHGRQLLGMGTEEEQRKKVQHELPRWVLKVYRSFFPWTHDLY